tara:strand:- start:381 stop:515 length:135 start_codon:yes stop_codon:yes gene_type:complete
MDLPIMFIGKILIIFLFITGCSNYKFNPVPTIIKTIIKQESKNE